MLFGYDSKVAFSKSTANLDDYATQLLDRLQILRLKGVSSKVHHINFAVLTRIFLTRLKTALFSLYATV